MKYAILVKAGGEIIDADHADYEDYKSFLKCPNCREPVFLRKAHFRNDIQLPASFVHHKAVREVSICELRVGKYTKQDVEAIATTARNQRLSKLKISLWKYLKYNLTVNLKSWSAYAQDAKEIKMLGEVIDYGIEVIENNVGFILDNTLSRLEVKLREQDPTIGIVPQMQPFFNAFIKENRSSWQLHCKIAKEALDLFLTSYAMKDIRYRLLCCLCHPTALESMPELLDLDASTTEWQEKFIAYITLQVTFVFLTVNWVKIFDS